MEPKTPVELWCEALRSGAYKQTTGHLCGAGGFCCLGVACDLYQKHVGGLDVGQHEVSLDDVIATYNDEGYVLPTVVRDWLGLTDDEGSYCPSDGDSRNTLHELNDNRETFDKIADIIESRPEGLFT